MTEKPACFTAAGFFWGSNVHHLSSAPARHYRADFAFEHFVLFAQFISTRVIKKDELVTSRLPSA